MGWARTLLTMLLERSGARDGTAPSEGEPPSPLLLDANTRTFWSHGAVAPATLVEAGNGSAPDHPAGRRLSELVASRAEAPPPDRPRANPAFSETVFVELMRARQYSRAFQLLSVDCQMSWGTAERFAAQNGSGALTRLLGVDVKQVRFLDEWKDPRNLTIHRGVAELDVEYALGSLQQTTVVARTVHLVAAGGQWRSVCYPDRAPLR